MSLKQEAPSMKRFPLVFPGLVIVLASYSRPLPLAEGVQREPVRAKSQAQARGSGLPTLPAKDISEIDALLQQAVRQGTIPGVVAIVANKESVLYHGAFGLMDKGKGKPMQKGSIFRIASMTKPITSVAVMMLKQEGKLSLDDPVYKYLSSFQNREVISSFNTANATYIVSCK